MTKVNTMKVRIIDCKKYVVEILDTEDGKYYPCSVKYVDKNGNCKNLLASSKARFFDGKIELKFNDNNPYGDEMTLTTSLESPKDMFDFLGKGYEVFNDGFIYPLNTKLAQCLMMDLYIR